MAEGTERKRNNRAPEIPVNELHELFAIDGEGWLVRKRDSRRSKAGQRVGRLDHEGYVVLSLNGTTYRAHRIIYAMTRGAWPNLFIDHIDGNKSNNRPENLREATVAENAHNIRGPHKDSVTGILGVWFNGRKYRAIIKHHGKTHHLGWFSTGEDASAAYWNAKRKFHDGCVA